MTTKPKSVILSNYLWIPQDAVAQPPEQFASDWVYDIELLKTPEGRDAQMQIENLRREAELVGDDPNDAAKLLTDKDTLTVRNYSEFNGWVALCCGDRNKVDALCRRLKLTYKDQRVESPWPDEVAERLKLVMEPREYQREPFARWMAADHGIFEAAPAYGKTLTMIWSIITRQQRTLVLVGTDKLAAQFIERFRDGSPTPDGHVRVTNCLDVEHELGQVICGRYSTPAKLYPVTVATWQSFISATGRANLKKISKSFGYVLCDEAHIFAAPAPAAVVNSMHAKWRGGVTATSQRKDNLDVALFDVVGPVTAEGRTPQLPMTSYMVATGQTYKAGKYPTRADWVKILNWLTKQTERNELIARWLTVDVADGRHVLVLSERVKWCFTMARALTTDYGIEARSVVGGLSSKKAIKDRDQAFADMLEDKVKVIFATSVVKLGLDVPILDTLYDTAPGNNAPVLEQKLGRIRRPYEGKKDPIYRYFCDTGHGLLLGCARGTQKALTELGSEIVLVAEGRDPAQVMRGIAPRARAGLARAGSHRADSLSALFRSLQ